MEDKQVNLHKLQVHTMVESAPYLKGILQVLCDMHCKGMTQDENKDYVQRLEDSMKELRDSLLNVSAS